ncbi:MAG: hydantoinase B/oxoprolinase family protein [Acidobacteria bacterium]|nr:hydantoinase B/oxoprolinase family protein [Acidobacteriota bacterium]
MSDSYHPIKLEIYRNLFSSVAQEMGTVLRRTAYSPNIKERRDYSCALFDGQGQLVAMGDHMPVHLGSMPLAVRAAIDAFPLHPGDVVFLNDPFAGGTHLPDVTMVAALYEPSNVSRPVSFVACRAHHSDVGGISPGSMPLSTDIFQEGIRIPPVRLYQRGELNRDLLRLVLLNVRTPREREGDLAAQIGSLKVGEKRLLTLVEKNGRQEVEAYMKALQDYGERVMRELITRIPDGCYRAEDFLDDDGTSGDPPRRPINIKVSVEVHRERMKVDFSGSHPQVRGCVNAVEAITLSAVYYVLRCLAPDDAPTSSGLLRPVEVITPAGTIVNASYPAATAGGNVETSQRIVDVLLRALSTAGLDNIPAASSGTMNNLTVGSVGPNTGQTFSYYETIGGGMGASPQADGDSGVHTHMTNTLNTPIEALETYFPVRVREYRLRRESGGQGKFRGGDGIIRSLEMLADCQVTMLSERRRHAPYGLHGGESGKTGKNYLIVKGKRKKLPGKFSLSLSKGEIIRIETPGGGGWGKKQQTTDHRPQTTDHRPQTTDNRQQTTDNRQQTTDNRQ